MSLPPDSLRSAFIRPLSINTPTSRFLSSGTDGLRGLNVALPIVGEGQRCLQEAHVGVGDAKQIVSP